MERLSRRVSLSFLQYFCLVKDLWAGRGVRDGEHEQIKEKIGVELGKVQQKERITKIIHETYVREVERVKSQMEDRERQAHEHAMRLQWEQEAQAKKM
jgi:hypothetical protein